MCDSELNEVDGFMEDLEFEVTPVPSIVTRKAAKAEKTFIILSVADIVAKMVAIVLEVQEILPVSCAQTRNPRLWHFVHLPNTQHPRP